MYKDLQWGCKTWLPLGLIAIFTFKSLGEHFTVQMLLFLKFLEIAIENLKFLIKIKIDANKTHLDIK